MTPQYVKPYFCITAQIGSDFETPCPQKVKSELKFGFSMLKLVYVPSLIELSSPMMLKMKLPC